MADSASICPAWHGSTAIASVSHGTASEWSSGAGRIVAVKSRYLGRQPRQGAGCRRALGGAESGSARGAAARALRRLVVVLLTTPITPRSRRILACSGFYLDRSSDLLLRGFERAVGADARRAPARHPRFLRAARAFCDVSVDHPRPLVLQPDGPLGRRCPTYEAREQCQAARHDSYQSGPLSLSHRAVCGQRRCQRATARCWSQAFSSMTSPALRSGTAPRQLHRQPAF